MRPWDGARRGRRPGLRRSSRRAISRYALGGCSRWAISTSRLLQRGEPLEFLQKFVGIRQEPSGMTNNKDIRSCTSVVDYVARYLLLRFAKKVEESK